MVVIPGCLTARRDTRVVSKARLIRLLPMFRVILSRSHNSAYVISSGESSPRHAQNQRKRAAPPPRHLFPYLHRSARGHPRRGPSAPPPSPRSSSVGEAYYVISGSCRFFLTSVAGWFLLHGVREVRCMKLWEELLVLRTRFEERSKSSPDDLVSETWGCALEELDALIKRQTRTDTSVPYKG